MIHLPESSGHCQNCRMRIEPDVTYTSHWSHHKGIPLKGAAVVQTGHVCQQLLSARKGPESLCSQSLFIQILCEEAIASGRVTWSYWKSVRNELAIRQQIELTKRSSTPVSKEVNLMSAEKRPGTCGRTGSSRSCEPCRIKPLKNDENL